MYMRFWIAGTLLLSSGSARADHGHGVEHGGASAFGAHMTMVAASFDTMLYVGNYQGVIPSLHWSNETFAAGASVALYRLEENGAEFYGFGDAVAHGQATLVRAGAIHAGAIAAVSAPVGDELRGMGMGHPMLMPALFGMWMHDRVMATATAGYSRAIGGDTDHDHGMWPLVEPMNLSELTWSAAGDYSITRRVQAGARVSGGVPIGSGDNRVIAAVRVGWASGHFTSAGELQAGLVGDPFTIRGVLTTGWSF
jgi:hypothetical protein